MGGLILYGVISDPSTASQCPWSLPVSACWARCGDGIKVGTLAVTSLSGISSPCV